MLVCVSDSDYIGNTEILFASNVIVSPIDVSLREIIP